MCVFPIVAVAEVEITKYRLNPLYSLLILFGGGFFLTTYLISIFQLVSLPLSRAIRWKGGDTNTISSQKGYDLNGILLSSPPIDVLWIMYCQ